MRTTAIRSEEALFDDSYFERKARDLVVADDEIEAWEFDTRDLRDLADFSDDDFTVPRLD